MSAITHCTHGVPVSQFCSECPTVPAPTPSFKHRLQYMLARVDDLISAAESMAVSSDDAMAEDVARIVDTLVNVRSDLQRMTGRSKP
jgi:hypothetical protein